MFALQGGVELFSAEPLFCINSLNTIKTSGKEAMSRIVWRRLGVL